MLIRRRPSSRNVTLALLAGALLLVGCSTSAHAAPNDRETKVRNDKQQMDANDFWIYNDLERGLRTARQDKKPLMVVFRCIP